MIKLLDCTLRDGGYYNAWDFSTKLIVDYLLAMEALCVDFVEIGFRTLKNEDFKGGCAFSTDEFLNDLTIPDGLKNKIAVMINGSEIANTTNQTIDLESLFLPKSQSHVSLVRIACHVNEFESCLPAAVWLKEQGYLVGFNLMQVADRSLEDITDLAVKASAYPVDILYFADSMGSLTPQLVSQIVKAFQKGWSGDLGIHTHDNMGHAVANTMQAVADGVTWVDSTVTGMGRGPGNAQTEYLSIAVQDYRLHMGNPTKLYELIRKYFRPMQTQYGWGINPYYYFAGKYGIHPSYMQEMLQDSRYSDEDMIAVIEHLRVEGGKKFSLGTLEAARHFYSGDPVGVWCPAGVIKMREVIIIGTGPSVKKYKTIIERHIQTHKPFVIALNTEASLEQHLIDVRAACHPVRLLADCHEHLKLPQPLITPFSMLPVDVQTELNDKIVYDFGLQIDKECFGFRQSYCVLPNSLVFSYALAIANSGQAATIKLVGFDGYSSGDPRNHEMAVLLNQYYQTPSALPICSLTPTSYEIRTQSIYGI